MYPAVHYNNRYFLFAASFASAVFIVLFDQDISFFKAWAYLSFYPAVACSMVISGILIGYIHWVTTWLDKRYPWDVQTTVRSRYQSFLGLVVPCILAYLLAAIYFWAFGYSILDPECEYLKDDYPVIVLMLLILNMYYTIHCFIILKRGATSSPQNQKVNANTQVSETLPVGLLAEDTINDVSCDALYYFIKNEINFMCDKVGVIHRVSFSLSDVLSSCTDQSYFKINRWVVIRHDTFQNFEPGSKKRTLQLTGLHPACANTTWKLTTDFFTVSENVASSFKIWFVRWRS